MVLPRSDLVRTDVQPGEAHSTVWAVWYVAQWIIRISFSRAISNTTLAFKKKNQPTKQNPLICSWNIENTWSCISLTLPLPPKHLYNNDQEYNQHTKYSHARINIYVPYIIKTQILYMVYYSHYQQWNSSVLYGKSTTFDWSYMGLNGIQCHFFNSWP